MFNLKHFKLVKKLKNFQSDIDWLNFSASQSGYKDEFLESLISENKFVQEDMKLRFMVESIIKKEFPERLKDEKSYSYLVDCVVNRLKQKQLGDIPDNSGG